MRNLSDKELFEKIQQGENKALEVLFARYYNTLCNFSVKISQRIETAEEIVADVFYTLWDKASDLTIEKSIKSYLFAAVKYKSFELLKLKSSRFE